jgi:hypothetical protein
LIFEFRGNFFIPVTYAKSIESSVILSICHFTNLLYHQPLKQIPQIPS